MRNSFACSDNNTVSPCINRSFQQLFYSRHLQIASTSIKLYSIELNGWQLPIAISLKDIHKLRDRLAIYNWQLIDGMLADSVKILAAAERFIVGGAK